MQKLADFGFANLQTQIELLKTTTILNNTQFMREAKILVQNHNTPSILQTGSLQSEFTNTTGDRYVSYFLLKGDMINLKGWGVTEDSIPKHIGSFKNMPFTITSKKFFANSPYGEITDHPVTDHFRKLGITRPLEINDMIQQSKFQEEFRVGNIDDIFKDVEGNWMAFIKIKPQFASFQMPPLVSPAIFQIDRTEPAGHITNWLGMHLAGLDESPAYGNIALFKGSCDGTKGECMKKLSASITSRFDEMVITPCMIKKINTRIASTEIDLKLIKLQTAFTESDHPRDNSGEFSSGSGGSKKSTQKDSGSKLTLSNLKTQNDVNSWIVQKSKEFGGKGVFTSSEEYRNAYPKLIKIHKNEIMNLASIGIEAMKEKGHNFGDHMHYDQFASFGGIKKQDGILTKGKNGIPVVKLDVSRKTIPWHKGWIKDD